MTEKQINWSFQAFEGTLVLGYGKCQPDEDAFHRVFQLENYISFPWGFYAHVSCIPKSKSERTRELSLIFCLMLHCIKCSAGFDAGRRTQRNGYSGKALRFIIITCGILNSCPKVLFISTYFQFHAASITPAPLRWQRLSHRPLPLLKDDEWSAELQVKDDVWSPAADGSVSVTAHQWRQWWTSGWKRALIKEPHAQQRICRPSPVRCHRGWIQ